MSEKTIIFWFRKDLRIQDNIALEEAGKEAKVFPIYINDDNDSDRPMGAASKVWLYHSLKSLNISLENNLNYFKGNAFNIIKELLKNKNIKGIFWNRCYEPSSILRDTKIKRYLLENDIAVKTFNGSLIREPWDILKDDNTPYKVFTPFYKKAYLALDNIRKENDELVNITYQSDNQYSDIEVLKLLSNLEWEKQLISKWDIGEKAAIKKLDNFLENGIIDYKEGRNFPSKNNVSMLSPHLHFGEISPKRIWINTKNLKTNKDTQHFLSEICWREFSYYLLYHFPSLPLENL